MTALRLLDVEGIGYRLRWHLEHRHGDTRRRLVAYSTEGGLLLDVHVMDAAEITPSARLREAIAERIAEELARVRLPDALSAIDRRNRGRAA